MRSFSSQLLYLFTHLALSDVMDIALVGIAFFTVLQALHQTRASQLLRGVIVFAILGTALLALLPLTTFNLLLRGLLLAGIVALPLLFQDELRRALLELGRVGRRRAGREKPYELVNEAILKAVAQLASQKIGALIVLEAQTPLAEFIATGIPVQAATVTAELLTTIFHPNTALHDGAVMLRSDRLAAAGCILPLRADKTGDTHLGTRHRAALGLSAEVPDALVVLVSEETGRVSVAQEGRLHRGISAVRLAEWLDRFQSQLAPGQAVHWRWLRGNPPGVALRNLALALGLACAAWLAVTFQANPPGQTTVEDVKLTVVAPAADLVRTSPVPPTVSVVVQADQNSLAQLTANSVAAEVALDALPAGVHRVPVRTKLADENAEALSITPAFIDVTLEPFVSTELTPSVTVPDADALPLGYSLGALRLTPESIVVSGPQSLVEQVAQARAALSVAGRRAEFQQSLSLTLVDAAGAVVAGLQLEPDAVVATVPIRRTSFTRAIAVQAALTNTLPDGYEIASAKLSPPSVTLAGQQAAVEQAGDFLSTAPIDLTEVRSEVELDVPLILPDGVLALDAQGNVITTVSAHIQVRPVTDYLTLGLGPSLVGDSDTANVRWSPAYVSVLLIGPKPLLAQVRAAPSMVSVTLDVSGYGPGMHNVRLIIRAPDGLQAEAFPAEVRVTIP